MNHQDKIKELRESTGMNRKEFCAFFEIPYRTVTDWELDRRHAPDYVLRLLEYYIRHEQLDTHECMQKSFAIQNKDKPQKPLFGAGRCV